MSEARQRPAFHQRDVTKAVKGARAAGLDVTGVKITSDGTITVQIGKSEQVAVREYAERNPWDELLAVRIARPYPHLYRMKDRQGRERCGCYARPAARQRR